MLSVMRQIVQEVNEAQNLPDVLRIIVHRVSEVIQVEGCSIFLVDNQKQQYILSASVGFLSGVDGQVALSFSEGLVSLVGEREEPINLSDAKSHPRYHYVPQTGEERYQSFLGVPMIHQRKLVGILVVQGRHPRRFDEGEVAFLVTISAQLAGYIAHVQTTGKNVMQKVAGDLPMTLQGICAAQGIAIGKAVVVLSTDLDGVPDRQTEDIEKEIHHLEQAFFATHAEIERLKTRLAKTLLPQEQNLFDAYLSILNSRSIKQEIIGIIHEGHWAPWALRKVIKRQAYKFEAMEDPYLRERAADLLDLGRRVLTNLQSENLPLQDYPKDAILVGDDISASILAELSNKDLLGIVSVKGSANSHVAILARAMGIPAVVGVVGLLAHNVDGQEIIVDGYHGEVMISPNPAMREDFLRLAREEKELYAGLNQLQDLSAQTLDNVRVSLFVNAGLVADIRPALQAGAEGVGLYRTEVPFMIRDRFPTEEEQFLIYRQLLESFAPKPVTIRTLDIGGDKSLSYFPIQEQNPYLGWRGIRITLDHPDIFLIQLRAMLRANAGFKNLRVLFPMISNINEIEEALRLLRQAHAEVVDEGHDVRYPETGAMIEVPSAVYQAHELIKRVDFLSVGSNDLTQYLLAVDRNNAQVANIYDSLHPAVICALKIVVDAAHAQHKRAAICGEMAGDPLAVILLLGLGYDILSMNAHNIPQIKWIIRNFTHAKAKQLVEEIMGFTHSIEIRKRLENALEEHDLSSTFNKGGK